MATQPRAGGTHSAAVQGGRSSAMVWQALSALLLLAMGAIHLHLVVAGTGGLLGILFVLNAVGGVVLGIAMLATPLRYLHLASVLSLLLMVGTLLALVLALTVGLFGFREGIGGQLVVTTLVVESLGTIVLAVTTGVVFRLRRTA